jgi:non-homologous end joining protein Ku
MSRSSWSGAITFAGLPIPVKAYSLASTTKNESFKTLCTCHDEPIKQANTCATTNAILTAGEQHKGVEHGKGTYIALDANAIASITGTAGSTVALEIERISPLATLDLHAHLGGFVIVPEPKKGAEKPVAILWRILSKLDSAIVTRWTMRAGSRDSTLAIYAGPNGLLGATLPQDHQLSSPPTFDASSIAVADAELAMFENAIAGLYPHADYAASDFPSHYNERRAKAVEAAVSGAPVSAAAPAVAPVVPDLMAALSASLSAAEKVAA